MPFLDDQAGLVAGDLARLISVGDIIMNVRATPRAGFLACDWSLLDELLFPELFNAIGTAFNKPGDPPGFFRVPPSGGMSPMGAGSTAGYTTRALGEILGEETHALTATENGTHTHLQDAHTHLQNSHTHTVTDGTHTHTSAPHTHLQNSHNHTQNFHNHTYSFTTGTESTTHNHTLQGQGGLGYAGGSAQANFMNGGTGFTSNPNNQLHTHGGSGTTASVQASNQVATAVNQDTTVSISSALTGVTNQSTTAVNQDTTATNQNSGSGAGHNTIHPVVCYFFYIRYE